MFIFFFAQNENAGIICFSDGESSNQTILLTGLSFRFYVVRQMMWRLLKSNQKLVLET